jgi:hypothetical protein
MDDHGDLIKVHLELVNKWARLTAALGLHGDEPIEELLVKARALMDRARRNDEHR